MVSEGMYIEYIWIIVSFFCTSKWSQKAGVLNISGLSSPFLCAHMVSEGRYIEFTWVIVCVFMCIGEVLDIPGCSSLIFCASIAYRVSMVSEGRCVE